MNEIKKDISKAFTLVELLVVIAVIGLLLAILMPALIGARERARQIACCAHLKQLSLATYTYATTTEHTLVYLDAIDRSEPNMDDSPKDWAAYGWGSPASCLINNGDLEDDSLFRYACPSSSRFVEISYGWNYHFLGGPRTAEISPGGHGHLKFTEIEIPSETGMFTDGHVVSPGWPYGTTQKPGAETGDYGLAWWADWMWVGVFAPIGHRDHTQANVAFADGHTKSTSYDILSVDFSDPKSQYFWYLNIDVYVWKRQKGLENEDW